MTTRSTTGASMCAEDARAKLVRREETNALPSAAEAFKNGGGSTTTCIPPIQMIFLARRSSIYAGV
jgi:hypothetical protein